MEMQLMDFSTFVTGKSALPLPSHYVVDLHDARGFRSSKKCKTKKEASAYAKDARKKGYDAFLRLIKR
jgi:hypothetical protein